MKTKTCAHGTCTLEHTMPKLSVSGIAQQLLTNRLLIEIQLTIHSSAEVQARVKAWQPKNSVLPSLRRGCTFEIFTVGSRKPI